MKRWMLPDPLEFLCNFFGCENQIYASRGDCHSRHVGMLGGALALNDCNTAFLTDRLEALRAVRVCSGKYDTDCSRFALGGYP